MSVKKRKKKGLARMDSLDTLVGAATHMSEFGNSENDNGQILEYKPRTSSSEKAWNGVPKDHIPNIERYNYRVMDPPKMSLLDSRSVRLEGGEERPLPWVKRIIAIAAKCRREKTSITIRREGRNGDPSDAYDLFISASGDVTAGCQFYAWDDIQRFQNTYLRGRK